MTRFFILKSWLAGAGVAVGLAGMAMGRRWLVWIAMVPMAAAFLLRFAERPNGTP